MPDGSITICLNECRCVSNELLFLAGVVEHTGGNKSRLISFTSRRQSIHQSIEIDGIIGIPARRPAIYFGKSRVSPKTPPPPPKKRKKNDRSHFPRSACTEKESSTGYFNFWNNFVRLASRTANSRRRRRRRCASAWAPRRLPPPPPPPPPPPTTATPTPASRTPSASPVVRVSRFSLVFFFCFFGRSAADADVDDDDDLDDAETDTCREWQQCETEHSIATLFSVLPPCPCTYPTGLVYNDRVWDPLHRHHFRWRDISLHSERQVFSLFVSFLFFSFSARLRAFQSCVAINFGRHTGPLSVEIRLVARRW